MRKIALKHIPLRTPPEADWSRAWQRIFLGLFVLQYLVAMVDLWLGHRLFGQARWPLGVLLVLAAATTLATLGRQLPGQNVMLASAIIAVLGGAAHTLGALSGVPFGPFVFTENVGQELFHPLPWTIPVIWIVFVLNARGVARLMLRPWRSSPVYGLWLLGLTVLLVVSLAFQLEPFAQSRRLWVWQDSRVQLRWYGAPWVNFIGWGAVTLLILAFATPALINKKPGKPPPPDYHPLILWLMLAFFFGTSTVLEHQHSATILISTLSMLVGATTIYGAFSKSRQEAPRPT